MNEFLIGIAPASGVVTFMLPLPQQLTREQAIALAAWLVVIADPMREKFDDLVEEIQSS